MNDPSNKVNVIKSSPNDLKMCCKVEKYSARGISFNSRVVYIDHEEVRYYSKPPKNFTLNQFSKLIKAPKMGVPTGLCEI
jgi:hypothetical protein